MKSCRPKFLPWWALLLIALFVIILVVFLAWMYWQMRIITHAPDLKGLLPANNFAIQRYVSEPGTPWHEIQRIPNSFEAGLDRVTAEYVLQPNGTVSVTNIGYDSNGQKQSITGKALQTNLPAVLMVSFFPFFEAPYIVLHVDEQYESAIVGSPNQSVLWFLARGSALGSWTPEKTNNFKQIAISRGYSQEAVDKLVPVPLKI